ncbi:MAG: PGF-CTERM protein [Halobacteriales archaeon]|jgi:PGF-CTERM protein
MSGKVYSVIPTNFFSAMSYSTRKSIAVVLVALMLVVVPASAAATTTPARPDAVPEESPANVNQVAVNNSTDVGPADTVYVTEDGDAVLVYREETNETTRLELGLDMSEGLMHTLVTEELDSEVTGTAQAAIGQSEFLANGSMTAPKPDELESLDATAEVTRTSSEATSSLTLDAVVESEDSMTGQAGTISTEGQLRSTASSFDFSGSASASGTSSAGAMGPMEHSVSITETETGYTVDVAQDYEVSHYARQQWDTRENATRTLEMQYGLIAEQLGGESEVTIDAYDFTESGENTYRLDIEYTIEYRDVHEAVTQQLTQTLAEAENLTLSQPEARDISERLQELEVERISGSVTAEEEQMTADWDVQFENFDTVALALLDLAESAEEMPESTQEQLDRVRTQLEAGQEAGLVQTASWQGELEAGSDGTATVSFQAQSEAENWGEYVSALEERGIDTTTYQLRLSATTTDGEVTADLEVTMSDEDLLAQMFSPGAMGSDAPNELSEAARTFRQADFERAKMDISAEDGQLRVEAGAKFANASAFADLMQETYGHTVESVVSQPEDGSQVTYVRVEGLVDGSATESDVRSLDLADEDTEIKLPGEWDREFPAMDSTSAAEFLGVEPPEESGSSGNGSSGNGAADDANNAETATTADDSGGGGSGGSASSGMPGFGLGVALVALLAGLALVSRRRTE